MTTGTQLIDTSAKFPEATWADGIETTIALTFLSTPDGDVKMTWRLSGSQLSGEALDSTNVEVSIDWKDAQAIATAELEPAVAYMQGRLKPSGDMGVVLQLLERTSTAEFRSWISAARP